MKGPPQSPSITNAETHTADTHVHIHTNTHVHAHSLHPSPPVAGLSEVSVISCPARLNYDVNKSPLVLMSIPT